ncbi:alpha/beta-Hydrolase [Glarea lozoyensis ATCC 20868]|uniref:Alpha/beta-Hydrolase n=1 Tax=Glarea lozoyensis (strain ATCC 20868 / MF5171) TaxID=1116229 RepID=S3CVG0_GLAL2|nr:alpha/beta-Hydrolase [Glarea lozoyensis ATCC 20868]EPE30397.1 alpha/beta-Hydrolase [Glarea lozoyensis ATCC 20868]
MSVSKPTFLIVPGAWHPSSAYQILADQLNAANCTAVIATHPSLNSKEPSSVTCAQDAQAVRSVLLSLLDKNEDVVVVAHSYGCVTGSGAAYGLSKASRAKAGKRSGVIGIVCIAGFLLHGGANMSSMKPPAYVLLDQPEPGFCETSNPADIFYHDLDEQSAASMVRSLQPQAMGPFASDSPPTAWEEPEFEGKLAYVRATQDRAVPLFVQDMMMEKSQVKWLVKDIETSHSPFLSRPKELTNLLLECVDHFLVSDGPQSTT